MSLHKIPVHCTTKLQGKCHFFPLSFTWTRDFSLVQVWIFFFPLSESVASMVEKILGISFVCLFTVVKTLNHPNSKISTWLTTRVSTDRNAPRISISSCWDVKKRSISQDSWSLSCVNVEIRNKNLESELSTHVD